MAIIDNKEKQQEMINKKKKKIFLTGSECHTQSFLGMTAIVYSYCVLKWK